MDIDFQFFFETPWLCIYSWLWLFKIFKMYMLLILKLDTIIDPCIQINVNAYTFSVRKFMILVSVSLYIRRHWIFDDKKKEITSLTILMLNNSSTIYLYFIQLKKKWLKCRVTLCIKWNNKNALNVHCNEVWHRCGNFHNFASQWSKERNVAIDTANCKIVYTEYKFSRNHLRKLAIMSPRLKWLIFI